MLMNYDYASVDLLKSPQKYQYTQYFGLAFIEAWKAQRKTLMTELPVASLPKLLAREDRCTTYQQLAEICNQLRVNATSLDNTDILLFYLKKFEVTKRLYAEYSDTGKAIKSGSSYSLLANYLLLAENCIYKWQQDHSSYWLNALLKINDTLSTQYKSMSVTDQAYLHWILLAEAEFIAQLEEKTR